MCASIHRGSEQAHLFQCSPRSGCTPPSSPPDQGSFCRQLQQTPRSLTAPPLVRPCRGVTQLTWSLHRWRGGSPPHHAGTTWRAAHLECNRKRRATRSLQMVPKHLPDRFSFFDCFIPLGEAASSVWATPRTPLEEMPAHHRALCWGLVPCSQHLVFPGSLPSKH